METLDIAVQIVKSTGPVKPSGIEASAMKKISAVISATILMNARRSGKKKTNLQKRNKSKL